MTLCTARLNIGSTRFFDPLNVPIEPVLEDIVDLRELLRCKADPITLSSESSDMGAGLSERVLESAEEESSTIGDEGLLGRSMLGVVGVTGAEREVASVVVDVDTRDTPETDRSRVRVSLTTSWICRLRGFFAEVGGGRTMIYVFLSAVHDSERA